MLASPTVACVPLLLPSLLLLSSSVNTGFPYSCPLPFVATFPTVAVVLCKCWLPLQLPASLCCYLPYCFCRPLQMLASHTVVCVPLLLPSLLLLSSSVNAGFPYCCLRPFVAPFPTVAVILCSSWLPLQLFASLCCYLPYAYCCCRPL